MKHYHVTIKANGKKWYFSTERSYKWPFSTVRKNAHIFDGIKDVREHTTQLKTAKWYSPEMVFGYEEVLRKNPLTKKGKEIYAAMEKEYGNKAGQRVFYASKNKGTIKGVEKRRRNPVYVETALKGKIDGKEAYFKGWDENFEPLFTDTLNRAIWYGLSTEAANYKAILKKNYGIKVTEFKVSPLELPAARKSNPSSRAAQKASELFEGFTGHEANEEMTIMVPDYPKALTVIGPCVAIAYETTRDGETAQYQHEFSKSAAPLLCASPDGRQLFLIGGAYEFRDTGINDD